MEKQLTEQEQLDIIQEVEEKYSKFLDPNFDASVFLECRDNFALTSHIESVKIFEMDNPPSNPTFTIAIPTYNQCETLKEAIDSALAQETDEHYEIIVVENVDDFDKKTEAQEMLERDYRGKLTYYKNKENIGLCGNWNRCLTLAKGKWVCILHSDDLISQNYIQEFQSILQIQQYDDAVLIGCKDTSFLEGGGSYNALKSFFQKNKKMDNRRFCFPTKNLISATAILHNRKKVLKIGGYNPDEHSSLDYFFVHRAYLNGEIYLYNKSLKTTQHHQGQYGKQFSQLLGFCILHILFVLKAVSPRFCADVFVFEEMQYMKDKFFREYRHFSSFVNTIMKKFNVKHKSVGQTKIIKGFYLCIKLLQSR